MLDLLRLLNAASPTVKIALASSAGIRLFDKKTSHLPELQSAFPDALRVFGDDPEMVGQEKKPSPDMFNLTLQRINLISEHAGRRPIQPDECLVFEDSIAGVEAGRKAGMRVIWVPHPGLAQVCQGHEQDVLMGNGDAISQLPKSGRELEEGATTDGTMTSEDDWAVKLPSLESFPFAHYGILIDS